MSATLRFADIAGPVLLVAVVGCLIFPLPPVLLDLLLSANIVFAIVLFVASLSITQPLQLSSFPTIILLATLWRISLNVATTRLILTTGTAGHIVHAFGSIAAAGQIGVGLILFLVITIVQFVVIAKGAERVAEVSARFTLDALPGRQMAIDADVRGGIIDSEEAKLRREDLQAESRFYGALDGAMKFVKGDAIAGLIITAINLIGGILIGSLLMGRGIAETVHVYSLLSIGDGLLSQIPSFLNAVSAGVVVTRVTRSGSGGVTGDLLREVTAFKYPRLVGGILSLVLSVLPAMPHYAFLTLGLMLTGSTVWKGKALTPREQQRPLGSDLRFPALFEIRLSPNISLANDSLRFGVFDALEDASAAIFQSLGILAEKPRLNTVEEEQGVTLYFRGVKVSSISLDSNLLPDKIRSAIVRFALAHAEELIDDTATRKTLDLAEQYFPHLVMNVTPGVITLTQMTGLLRALVAEGIPISNIQVVLQAICEHGHRVTERGLLGEVRVALRRTISDLFQKNGVIEAMVVDPSLDSLICELESKGAVPDLQMSEAITSLLPEIKPDAVILISKRGRRYLRELLCARGCTVAVLAHEEIVEEVNVQFVGVLGVNNDVPYLRMAA